jgi:hypothetical protein
VYPINQPVHTRTRSRAHHCQPQAEESELILRREMAERRSAVAPSVPAPACRPRGGGGWCGLGLARLVGRLRRQGKRALCSPARRRGCQCQYDPLSYARNFDLDAAHVYYSHSFTSRSVLASSPSSAAAVAAASAPSDLDNRPVVNSR